MKRSIFALGAAGLLALTLANVGTARAGGVDLNVRIGIPPVVIFHPPVIYGAVVHHRPYWREYYYRHDHVHHYRHRHGHGHHRHAKAHHGGREGAHSSYGRIIDKQAVKAEFEHRRRR